MAKEEKYPVSNKIFTIPNLISFIRLCLVPVFLILLLDGHNGAATFVFALAACTDFVDGQVARRTNSVSRLGQILDPLVDRVLMIVGVIGLVLVSRVPLWIPVLVILRDLVMLVGGAILLKAYKKRVDVIYPGKVATTFLFVGFAMLLLNWPLAEGLGVCEISWLPGFSSAIYPWGIWFVYIGLVISLLCTIYYIRKALKLRQEAIDERAAMEAAEAEDEDAEMLDSDDVYTETPDEEFEEYDDEEYADEYDDEAYVDEEEPAFEDANGNGLDDEFEDAFDEGPDADVPGAKTILL